VRSALAAVFNPQVDWLVGLVADALVLRFVAVVFCVKAFRREVLFAFEPAAPGTEPTFEESGKATRSPNLVLINVSPIEYGHVLLCPRVLDCLPQNLDPSTARLALHFALEVGNPYLRVGFNSLGAFATINHLHFQVKLLSRIGG
jgi:GDP-L-galactose phosphorylase